MTSTVLEDKIEVKNNQTMNEIYKFDYFICLLSEIVILGSINSSKYFLGMATLKEKSSRVRRVS